MRILWISSKTKEFFSSFNKEVLQYWTQYLLACLPAAFFGRKQKFLFEKEGFFSTFFRECFNWSRVGKRVITRNRFSICKLQKCLKSHIQNFSKHRPTVTSMGYLSYVILVFSNSFLTKKLGLEIFAKNLWPIL